MSSKILRLKGIMELDQEENVKICSVLVMDLLTKINIPDTFFITINFIT